jgi:hypothetical protein
MHGVKSSRGSRGGRQVPTTERRCQSLEHFARNCPNRKKRLFDLFSTIAIRLQYIGVSTLGSLGVRGRKSAGSELVSECSAFQQLQTAESGEGVPKWRKFKSLDPRRC